MLDDLLLEKFMNQFYGYGNLSCQLWFIGMEEGGGKSENEIAKRLLAWDARGRRVVEDLAEYHQAIGISELFEPKLKKIQRTWGKLIRSILAVLNIEPSRESIHSYQIDYWARSNGVSCLLELFPLPSPNNKDWRYDEISRLPILLDRASYQASVIRHRIEGLKNLLKLYKATLYF